MSIRWFFRTGSPGAFIFTSAIANVIRRVRESFAHRIDRSKCLHLFLMPWICGIPVGQARAPQQRAHPKSTRTGAVDVLISSCPADRRCRRPPCNDPSRRRKLGCASWLAALAAHAASVPRCNRHALYPDCACHWRTDHRPTAENPQPQGTLGGASARGALARAMGRDLPAALIEDVVAVGGAALIIMALA